MNFQPLGDRILVERIEEQQQTASGIYIPDNAKQKPLEAIVKAVGSDVKEIKVDDKIVFAQFKGVELKLDGLEYLVLESEDILGIRK